MKKLPKPENKFAIGLFLFSIGAITMLQTKILETHSEATEQKTVEVFGAREHNLKNINITFPRNKLIIITGISGSGKSSLAFDTIYAEGQRRYMESFSAYARSFIGNMERPDVDKINGLSPVISIEQKTTSKNPRSTVGTVTEVYDFLRLLFARVGEAFSYLTGEKMKRQTEDQIIEIILNNYNHQKLLILAPVVKGRKGHYRELFVKIRKQGFTKIRVDGEIINLTSKMQLDRYKTHDIEIVIDRIKVKENDKYRLSQSLKSALTYGKGVIMVLLPDLDNKTQHFSKFLMCPISRIAYDEPAPNLFSFNSPYGYCPLCKGLGKVEEINEDTIVPNKEISISQGAIIPLGQYRDIWIFKKIEAILKKYKLNIFTPFHKISQEIVNILFYGSQEEIGVNSVKYSDTIWHTKFDGIINFLQKQKETGTEKIQQWVADFVATKVCPECNGDRLKKESLHFKIDGLNIAQLAAMDIENMAAWFDGIELRMTDRQNLIAAEILKEIRKRLGFLEVNLNYLTLNRPLSTLSGGEAQRIRLATQIGTQLVGVLYILDEPSIGLHQRDNLKLIKALQELRDLGNTVIVVEHDKDIMLQSDYIIDIGPGAGIHGGKIVAAGSPEEFLKQESQTAHYLNGVKKIETPKKRRKGTGKKIILKEASGHNLKNITVTFPLGKMICITGVSGSGKSTLIHETFYPILNQYIYRGKKEPLAYKNISGLKYIDKVIEIDQSAIGRTPRSNPATYTGMFIDIRGIFTELPESKIRGYKLGRFSFNVKGGRCQQCKGGGKKLIEMDFLPDVYIDCESCKGKRYNRETLEVRFKGKSISDVLDMTVEQALEFFKNQPKIFRRLKALHEVGLDYITLGQHTTTLSGGEAQRVKLATELSKKDTGKTFYILDEPTTGLHFQDIQHLLDVLNKLVDKGNTVLIIEHNMDVIKVADHIIDIGAEGGNKGGHLVCFGTPEKVAKNKESYTANFLKNELYIE